MVHVPASTTTTTSTVTQATTTVVASSTATVMVGTPLTSTRTTPGFIRPLFGAQPPPRLVLGRDFRAPVVGHDGWVYYSEHYVQGIGGARERQSVPMIDARAEPPRLLAASLEQARQCWYTPCKIITKSGIMTVLARAAIWAWERTAERTLGFSST